MNLAKKILFVHSDHKTRRRCLMLLAGSGFDVRAYSDADSAAEGARNEWFDLALVQNLSPESPEFALNDRLRKIQPSLPLIMLVDHLEFPLVVQGIRQGVTDVLPMNGDAAPLISRVCAFFNVIPSCDADLSSEELGQAEAILGCLGGGMKESTHAGSSGDIAAQLLTAAREKALLERQLERLGHERNALETQLKTLIAQNGDITRQQREAAELRSQSEIIASAQAAIDEKARQLAAQRAELSNERNRLEEDKRRLENSGPVVHPEIAAEKLRLADWRRQLGDQAEQLRAEAMRVQQDRAHLASEQRSWHRDLDELRDKEDNLRRYEERLRELQAQLEAERVNILGIQMLGANGQVSMQRDENLEEAWIKLKRATEIFEAEKAHLREDRLAVREWEGSLKLREATLKAKESKLADKEKAMAAIHAPAPVPPPPSAGDMMRSFTRSPFAVARAAIKKGMS